MNKDVQTQVRILSEVVASSLAKADLPEIMSLWPVVAQLETARQLALLTEEVRRLNRRLEDRMGGT